MTDPRLTWWQWITAVPNIKGIEYEAADNWGNVYLEKHLPDGWKPAEGQDPSELIYEHAIAEMESVDDALKTLNTKCLELMKLLIAVVAAIVAAWKLFSSNTTANIQTPTHMVANAIAITGIGFFIYAMIILSRCLSSHEYVPAITTQKLLDWAGEDREHPAYIRMRTAVRVLRALAANGVVNRFVAERLDAAWKWTILGFVAFAFALALQLLSI